MRREACPASSGSFVPHCLLAVTALAIASATALAQAEPAPTPAPAPRDRVVAVAERAIADLADPTKVVDATRRLEHLGPRVVAELCERLDYARRQDLPASVQQQLVYVLGRQGRHALAALPLLSDLLKRGDRPVARQALWAIGELAPFVDEQARRELQRDVKNAAPDLDPWLREVVLFQLTLGADADTRLLLGMLRTSANSRSVAACRWLVAHAADARDDRAELRAALEEEITTAGKRDPIRWRNVGGPLWGPELAQAWLAWTREPLEAKSARLLLDHWHADERRRAIVWLRDHGAALPVLERADLVGRLWDVDPQLVVDAAAALGHWGIAGLVGLPALRLMARQADATVATACTRAADTIVAAAVALPERDRAWFSTADAVLRGQPATLPDAPCSAESRALFRDVLHVAAWNEPATIDELLRVVEAAGPCTDDAVLAVLGWLGHEEPRVGNLAFAFLARRGAQVSRVFDPHGSTFDGWMRHLASSMGPDATRRAAVEACAHMIVAASSSDDRAALLDDVSSRVIVRALAIGLAAETGALRDHTRRLHQLLEPPASTELRLVGGNWGMALPVDLSRHVRTLAAIALVDLGAELGAPEGLEDAVQQTLGVPLAKLKDHVADLRSTKRLPAVLDQIEDQCRLLLSVPPHLRWPTFTGSTR